MGQESALFQLVGRVCSGIAGLVSNPGSVTFSVSPKAQAKTASELSKSMETMRGHLQAQLRCKEAENCGLCMQIKNLERSGNQHKAEVEAIMEQLKELKQKGERDKESLKKAIRAQKERAEKSEEYAEQLHVQLADKVVASPRRAGRRGRDRGGAVDGQGAAG